MERPSWRRWKRVGEVSKRVLGDFCDRPRSWIGYYFLIFGFGFGFPVSKIFSLISIFTSDSPVRTCNNKGKSDVKLSEAMQHCG